MKARDRDSWSEHDESLWNSLWIARSVAGGRNEDIGILPTSFRPSMESGERIVACAAFDLSTHGTTNDGSYRHHNTTFFATGRLGLAVTAGALLANGSGNHRRQREAAFAAMPRWVHSDAGQLFVSTAGVYLQTVNGLFPWTWSDFVSCELVAPSTIMVQGTSSNGPISWLVRSGMAELILMLWAMRQHPAHSQLVQLSWLPDGWVDRAMRRHGSSATAAATANPGLLGP